MEKNENLKDEQVQHISGGENNETDIESWDQPNPYNDRPDLNPDGIPVSKLIKKKQNCLSELRALHDGADPWR